MKTGDANEAIEFKNDALSDTALSPAGDELHNFNTGSGLV